MNQEGPFKIGEKYIGDVIGEKNSHTHRFAYAIRVKDYPLVIINTNKKLGPNQRNIEVIVSQQWSRGNGTHVGLGYLSEEYERNI